VQTRNIIGSPAAGQNFYNRHKDQARLWDRLGTDNVLLLAPRRVGKTSLLYKLEATAEEHDFKSIYVSVASHDTEFALLQALLEVIVEHRGLARQLVTWAEQQLKNIKKLDLRNLSVELETREWQELGADLVRMLQSTEGRVLVMLDELPVFVLNLLRAHGRERTRLFLNWLREVRIDRRTRLSIRWLICGSIGLFDPWYQRLRDELGPVDEGHALALLEAAARDGDGAPHAVMQELMRSRGVDPHVARYLLGVLESDGYLIEAEQRWCFRSPLLRDYWRAHVLA
jgi:hypothetical protein